MGFEKEAKTQDTSRGQERDHAAAMEKKAVDKQVNLAKHKGSGRSGFIRGRRVAYVPTVVCSTVHLFLHHAIGLGMYVRRWLARSLVFARPALWPFGPWALGLKGKRVEILLAAMPSIRCNCKAVRQDWFNMSLCGHWGGRERLKPPMRGDSESWPAVHRPFFGTPIQSRTAFGAFLEYEPRR